MNAQRHRQEKIRELVLSEGFETLEALLEATACDSVSPAICIRKGCHFTCEMEPDQDQGFCEKCRRNSVVAAPVLAFKI